MVVDSYRSQPSALVLVPVLLTGMILAGCAGTSEFEATDRTFSVDYEKYTLANGLDVVLHIDRSDPIVAVVARSDASEWESITDYPSDRRPG